jgi:hypothetical protein
VVYSGSPNVYSGKMIEIGHMFFPCSVLKTINLDPCFEIA